jgi:hypothetical protein
MPMLRDQRSIAAGGCIAVLLAGLWSLPVLAQVDGEKHTPGAACDHGATAGHGQAPDWDTFFECNGSTQWQRGPYFFGSTSDTCDSNHKGLTGWDSTNNLLEYCNGSAWTDIEPVQSTPVETAPAGSGYFVLSHNTYNGNLGGLTSADATCLTDLTTNTGWLGYATANSNGQLIAAKVHAFLCSTSSCTQLMPLTTYYFANAGNSSAGGASFTTNSSGAGPVDSANWGAANYFSGTYNYWTGNTGSSSTVWSLNPDGNNYNSCAGFTGTGSTGMTGQSTSTNNTRWDNTILACTNTYNLICFVNP